MVRFFPYVLHDQCSSHEINLFNKDKPVYTEPSCIPHGQEPHTVDTPFFTVVIGSKYICLLLHVMSNQCFMKWHLNQVFLLLYCHFWHWLCHCHFRIFLFFWILVYCWHCHYCTQLIKGPPSIPNKFETHGSLLFEEVLENRISWDPSHCYPLFWTLLFLSSVCDCFHQSRNIMLCWWIMANIEILSCIPYIFYLES